MTQVSWKRQLVLALSLFVLGSLAYWLEFRHKPEKEAEEEQTKKLFRLKGTPVKEITLATESNSVTLSCSDFAAKLCKAGDNSKWQILQPSRLKADDSNANALLSTLNNLSSAETISLKDETPEKKAALLRDYGLDPQKRASKSARKIILETDAGKTVLYLGATHPIGESIFAVEEHAASGKDLSGKVDENTVYLVPSYFKTNLEHDLTYWRDKKLFALGAHDIEFFKLSGSKAQISGERKDGQWVLQSQGEALPGDTENIDSLLNTATFVSAKGFASDNKTDKKAKSILASNPQVLSLMFQKEKGSAKEMPLPITLTLFQNKSKAPGSKLYATVSNLDPLFELDPSIKDRLDKSVKDLRLAKLITSMERFSVKRIEFAGSALGSKPLVLVNLGNKWTEEGTPTEEIAQDKVQNLLDELSRNRIKEFSPASAVPVAGKESLTVTLGDEKEKAKKQILFWKKDSKLYAKDLLSKRNEIFLLDIGVQSYLPWEANFFKETKENPPKSGTVKK